VYHTHFIDAAVLAATNSRAWKYDTSKWNGIHMIFWHPTHIRLTQRCLPLQTIGCENILDIIEWNSYYFLTCFTHQMDAAILAATDGRVWEYIYCTIKLNTYYFLTLYTHQMHAAVLAATDGRVWEYVHDTLEWNTHYFLTPYTHQMDAAVLAATNKSADMQYEIDQLQANAACVCESRLAYDWFMSHI